MWFALYFALDFALISPLLFGTWISTYQGLCFSFCFQAMSLFLRFQLEEMWVSQKCFYHLQKQSKVEFFLGEKDNFFVIYLSYLMLQISSLCLLFFVYILKGSAFNFSLNLHLYMI